MFLSMHLDSNFIKICFLRFNWQYSATNGDPGSQWIYQSIHIWRFSFPWWRHQMGTFSALLAICAGNSPVNSPHKGQWRGTLMFSLICVWINDWVNNREAGDLRRYRAHYDVTLMSSSYIAYIVNSLDDYSAFVIAELYVVPCHFKSIGLVLQWLRHYAHCWGIMDVIMNFIWKCPNFEISGSRLSDNRRLVHMRFTFSSFVWISL